MFDLFKSEFKRYRLVALAAFFIQIFGWVLIGKMMVILQPLHFKHALLLFCALGSGIGMGAIQMWLHTRKNHWTYLIHRPMPMPNIHLALSAAAISIIALGFILPFFSVVAYLDIMTNNAVDVRHYLMALDLLLIAISAYFIMSYVMLSPSKLVLISLWILTYLAMRNNVAASFMLMNAAIFTILSFYMAHNAFKIDRTTLSPKKPMIILASISLQPLLFILLVMAQGIYYHLPLTMTKSHPSKDLSRDTQFAFKHLTNQQKFEKLFANSDNPLANSLQRQLPLAQFKSFKLTTKNEVEKGQLFTSDRSFALWDDEMNLWVFSHDEMVFKGRNLKTDKLAGYLTNKGFVKTLAQVTPDSRFEFVPNIISNKYVYTKNRLFLIDFEQRTITSVFQAPVNETIHGKPINIFDLSIIRTNNQLLLLDKTDAITADSPITPLLSVRFPVAAESLISVSVSQMTDGYLLLFSSDHFYGLKQGGSELIYVPHEGEVTTISTLSFDEHHYPRLLTEQYFTLSPIVVNVLDFSLGRLLTPSKNIPQSMKYFWQRDYPSYIWQFCIVMALLCALITFFIAKHLPMSHSNRWLWILLSAIGGLPGLGAFLILNDWREALRNARTNTKHTKQETSHV